MTLLITNSLTVNMDNVTFFGVHARPGNGTTFGLTCFLTSGTFVQLTETDGDRDFAWACYNKLVAMLKLNKPFIDINTVVSAQTTE